MTRASKADLDRDIAAAPDVWASFLDLLLRAISDGRWEGAWEGACGRGGGEGHAGFVVGLGGFVVSFGGLGRVWGVGKYACRAVSRVQQGWEGGLVRGRGWGRRRRAVRGRGMGVWRCGQGH